MNIGKWVHLSVNDVIDSLRWIHENHPDSVFNEPMLKAVKRWHREYNLTCDLYVFEEDEDFRLDMLEDIYWEEFSKESSWLRFCWHRRKKGLLADGLELEKQSFINVKNLLINKLSKQGGATVVRLHQGEASGELVAFLKEEGIRVLLIADADNESYDLYEDSLKKLKKYGICSQNSMHYKEIDVCLDTIDDADQLGVLQRRTQERINRFRNWRAEVCFHEWRFSAIKEKIEAYWENFIKYKYDLYINASVVVGDEIYFTDSDTTFLYKKNIWEESVQIVTKLQICKSIRAFGSMHYYCGKIWMLPWTNDVILIYDIEVDEQIILELPLELKYKDVFWRGIKEGKYLWAASVCGHTLVRIDMEELKIDFINQWPKEVSFLSAHNIDFKNISKYNGKIYAFKDDCSHSVVIDEETYEISICQFDTEKNMAIVSDGQVYISPSKEYEPLIIIDIENPTNKVNIELPEEIWNEHQWYAYWYCDCVGDIVYLLPHEANAIVAINKKNRKVYTICPAGEAYKTRRDFDKFAGYEVHSYDDYNIIMSYQGNEYIIVDKNCNIVKECYVNISIEELESIKYDSMMYESDAFGLAEWIKICDNVKFYGFNANENVWKCNNLILKYTCGLKILKAIVS